MGYYLPQKSYLRPKTTLGIRQRILTVTTASLILVTIGLSLTIHFGDSKDALAEFRLGQSIEKINVQQPLVNSNPATREFSIQEEIKFPVILAYFKTIINRKSIELKWSTIQEYNNESFIIEKSDNGTVFYEIGSVESKKSNDLSSDYSFIDYNKSEGAQFYRLKQTSSNGKSTFIALEKVKAGNEKAEMALFIEEIGPAPFNEYFNINYYSAREGGISVELFDKNGRKIYKTYITAKQGYNMCRFTDGKLLLDEEYTIRIANSSGAFVKKIRKKI
jgi:hypothetical protein